MTITSNIGKVLNTKSKIILNDILPFVKDSLNSLIVNNIFFENENFNIIENKTSKTSFFNECLKIFKENYELNSYNMDNIFFKYRKKILTNKNKNGKKLILKNIELQNNRSNIYFNFEFKIQYVNENKLIVEDFLVSLNIGTVNVYNKILKFYSKYELNENFKEIELTFNESNIKSITIKMNEYEEKLKAFKDIEKDLQKYLIECNLHELKTDNKLTNIII